MTVPNIDFRSLSFIAKFQAAAGSSGESGLCLSYGGPSPAVSRVANAVMVQGEVLPFQTPNFNASWKLDFFGPAILCGHVTGEQRSKCRENMIQPQDDETNWFASWFSSTHKSGSNHNNNDLPFSRKPTKSGIWNATIFSEGLLVPLNDVDLAFYIAAMPYQELP
jgi:hypothetical protein